MTGVSKVFAKRKIVTEAVPLKSSRSRAVAGRSVVRPYANGKKKTR